jgi:hypothetical protein
MKLIHGYVVVCRTADRSLLFGQMLQGRGDSENFESNGQVPFPTLAEARFVAARFLEGRDDLAGATVNVGRIKMEIAENQGDLDTLRRKRNRSFVVIYNYRGETVSLLGMHVVGARGIFDSGGYLNEKAPPFQDLEEALRLAREATRQGSARSAVAFYHLRVFARAGRRRRQMHSKQ